MEGSERERSDEEESWRRRQVTANKKRLDKRRTAENGGHREASTHTYTHANIQVLPQDILFRGHSSIPVRQLEQVKRIQIKLVYDIDE